MATAIFEQPIGQLLKQYKIIRLLGEGQTGPVYQARDLVQQHDVALKVLPLHLTERPGFSELFLEAARTAAQLEHPNIVKVLDFGWDHAVPFIVMERLPGETLHRLLLALPAQQRWLKLAEAAALTRQIALAVDYLRRQGPIQRRLQPSDIMFKPEPSEGLPYRPVLTDLGLANLAAGGLRHTGGSSEPAAYRAPEQAHDSAPDARGDVYALGVLLHKLAVGQLPSPAAAAPPLTALRPDLPEDLARIIRQALAPDPADRFAGAAELANALGAVWPALASQPDRGALSLAALIRA
ncbi:MAG: serine/threonine protein kinase, partial [Anaerolineales bacterium]|nr:serine/threonine protein kinase [Anaerolineales bacterium]